MKRRRWVSLGRWVSLQEVRAELERCRQMDIERQRNGEQDAFLAEQALPRPEDWRERAFRRAANR